MNVNKPFTLQPLMNLAQRQNESATRKLGELSRMQQGEEQKLETLREYRKDYQKRLQEATQNGMDPMSLRNFQQFIDKLDEAIRHQTVLVERSQASTQVGRNEFDTSLRKLKSFDTLQQRHMEAQKQLAGKQEQKMLDEHTGRFVARNMIEKQDK